MRVALFGKSFAPEHFVFFRLLVDKLEELGCEIIIWEPFNNFIKVHCHTGRQFRLFSSYTELPGNVDFLFSIGGDGTLLDTITLVRDSGIPVMGINLGRMGFISSISRTDIIEAINDIAGGNFRLDSRSLLRLETGNRLFGDLNFAMNELSINKMDPSSMILIHVYVNDQLLNSYWADGLIVATPTGSTGYSLSCNGPILTPESENFVITPIATHNLTVRPVVIPDNSTIRIRVESRDNHFLVGLDSRSATIDPGVEMVIKKENFKINLLQRPNDNFFATIRAKLLWGHDIRN
jgi:NAD+ kinase